MKVRYLALAILLGSSAALALCCAETPPPRAGEFWGVSANGSADAAGASVPNGFPPASPKGAPAVVSGGKHPTAPYPATPSAPPPVPPPPGQGSSLKLQKYIVVDQFGYRPSMSKVAILIDPQRGWNARDSYEPGPTLELKRWADGATVFQGPAVPWNDGALDERSGDKGSWFDFSSVQEAGTYYVYDAKNAVRSYPFEIAADVYRRVLKTATKMYYFNRANFAKKSPYACVGKRCWLLGADYLGPGQDREARSVRERDNAKTARDLSGGWWDAGDTNKYVTFSGNAVHPLLTAFEERPSAFGDDFGIPESGNGTPDLIDEILVELEWLKKMQPADLNGGALIKVGNVDYAQPLPDQATLKRYYYPEPCSAATIVIAGEFAHAALVLGKLGGHGAQAKELSGRATRAWDFYHSHPKSDACDDGTVKSGDADMSLADQERAAVVAAVYLFAVTGEPRFDDVVKRSYATTRPFQDDRWSVYEPAQGDALLAYATLASGDAATKAAILAKKRELAEHVDIYKFRPELDLYRAYMRADSYHWGSNNQRSAYGNNSFDLVQYGLSSESERRSYVERAAGMLHSFHGVNPMQLVYLTNMYADGGDACADETYHAWFRDKDPTWDNARTSTLGPAPGYLTGGPNQHYCDGQDPGQHACAKSPVREQPPEKAYVDSNTGWEPSNPFDKSWELSEPGIYYQAGYVRLISKFVD